MTQESKDLLLKDLCARLPYGVKCQFDDGCIYTLSPIHLEFFKFISNFNLKPYLRPMSSMTEKETVEYCDLQDKFLLSSFYPVTDGHAIFDWLDKKMFDFRGLIEKDAAIAVTEDNNPYKN